MGKKATISNDNLIHKETKRWIECFIRECLRFPIDVNEPGGLIANV